MQLWRAVILAAGNLQLKKMTSLDSYDSWFTLKNSSTRAIEMDSNSSWEHQEHNKERKAEKMQQHSPILVE